jgi:hypothetical protein
MIDSLPGMILSKLPNLLEFIYSNINMSDDGASQIAAIISTHSSLNHMLLRKSKIGDKGVIKLLDAIKVNKSMEHLELYNCEISYKGSQRIEKFEHKIRTHRKFKLNILIS